MPVDIVTTLYGRQERSWQLQANCMGVDPDLFFPERGASTREAKEGSRKAHCAGWSESTLATNATSFSAAGSPLALCFPAHQFGVLAPLSATSLGT